MDESRKLLEEESQKTNERKSSLTPGSEERAAAIEELSSLYKLKTEESKVLEDAKVRNDQLSDQKVDRWFKLGTAAAELILPLLFYGTWMKRGFQFEKEGTFTSTTFRGLFSKFKPTKK